jgi:DNA-directed RNA polymerase subunit N (RpoN/RPB10)
LDIEKINDKVASLVLNAKRCGGIWNSRNGFKYESYNNLVLTAKNQDYTLLSTKKKKSETILLHLGLQRECLQRKKGMW